MLGLDTRELFPNEHSNVCLARLVFTLREEHSRRGNGGWATTADDHIRDAVGDILADHGYQPLVAANGEEALSLLGESQPCLVLLDLRMPVMDGMDFLRAMQSLRKNGSTPVVIISAYRAQAGEAPGVVDFIQKPFRLEHLMHVVSRNLRRQFGDALTVKLYWTEQNPRTARSSPRRANRSAPLIAESIHASRHSRSASSSEH